MIVPPTMTPDTLRPPTMNITSVTTITGLKLKVVGASEPRNFM